MHAEDLSGGGVCTQEAEVVEIGADGVFEDFVVALGCFVVDALQVLGCFPEDWDYGVETVLRSALHSRLVKMSLQPVDSSHRKWLIGECL